MLDDTGSRAHLPRCGEWIGALVTFPSYVTGEGEPYKPTAVMWLEPETGCVVDSQLVRPEQALPRAAGLFHLATREPLAGKPRVPARVRVSDEALAHALRGSLGDVELVVAPTPEVDEVVASLTAHIARRDREDHEGTTHLGPGLQPADLAHLFAAAARLYRARPWDSMPPDRFLSVSCEALGITDGALTVVGQLGESFGFSLFRSVEDAKRFLAAAESGDRSGMPEHFMFMFDDRRELPEPMVQEIAHYRWEVAGPQAYPAFVVIDEDLVSRGLTLEEHVGMTAVVTALAEMVEREATLMDAWDMGERLEHTSVVETARGRVGVSLAAPLYVEEEDDDADGDPAMWECVLDPEGVIDDAMLDEHFDAFMSKFVLAPEATEEALPIAEMLVENAGLSIGVTIVGLMPNELKTLLFRVIPQRVTIEPEAAPLIIETLRGLLTFAERELGARYAHPCLAELGPAAEKRLARELADDRNFGPAKSLIVQGMRAGYDLTSEAGIAAFVESLNQGTRARKPRANGKVKPRATAEPKAKAKAKPKAKPRATAEPKAKAKAKAKAKPKAKARPTTAKVQPKATGKRKSSGR